MRSQEGLSGKSKSGDRSFNRLRSRRSKRVDEAAEEEEAEDMFEREEKPPSKSEVRLDKAKEITFEPPDKIEEGGFPDEEEEEMQTKTPPPKKKSTEPAV